MYIPVTIAVYKDDVCLFEADCDAKIDYSLPDGRRGVVDWDVIEFHFDAAGLEPGKRVYTKIGRSEPLFHLLYKDLDRDWVDEQVRDLLAQDGIIDLYASTHDAF